MMKLTTLILITAILQVSAKSYAQKVTISERNAPLKKVFEIISQQTGYDFLVSTENLKQAESVTVNFVNEDLHSALTKIFAEQPLKFEIQEKMVVVSKKDDQKLIKSPSNLLPKVVHGRVVDTTGAPIPGSTVKIVGTNKVAVSNHQGVFTINAQLGDKIEISFVGYQPYTFKIKNEDAEQLIILHVAASRLNEIQIIGYGTTTKRLNTGSTSSITSSTIEKQPVGNVLAVLQGRASGVSIQTQNGLPGGNISIQIRGQGSIASGTAPLYIIDGVPFLSSPILPYSQLSANGAISPFSVLNPGDIASIDILKDADATAIYGSRGANGVVLISTRKGVSGKTKVDVQYANEVSTISRYTPLLNLEQYLQMRKEAFKNDGLIPDASTAPDLLSWSQTKATDWQKFQFGNHANTTTLQTSLSGGNSNTNFLLSMNYRNDGSILPGDVDYKKGGGYFNLGHTSDDKKFSLSLTISYNLDDNHTLYNSSTTIGMLPPNYPVYLADGSYNFEANYNPVAQLDQRSRLQSDNLIVNNTLQYNLFKDLHLKLNLGYNRYHLNQLATLPKEAQSDLYFTPDATMYLTDNISKSWIVEPQADYTFKLGSGTFTTLAGGTLQQRTNDGNTLTGVGVNNPALLGNISAASNLYGYNDYTKYKYLSFFGRVNYNLLEKFIFDLNYRRDGSSRFGNARQFGNFGALGAAWLFSQENLIRDNLPFISYGKLRSSYGITGNDQITDYQYLSTYNSGDLYGGNASLVPSRIANPDYSWETTRQLENALEIGFYHDRLMLTVARYQRISNNQLVTYPLPIQSGFSGYQANLPAKVKNTGWEFDLNSTNIQTNHFAWKTSFNITIPKNKLVSYPDLSRSTYANILIVGQDLSVYKGFHFLGVDSQTGNAQYEDVNKDGIIRYPEDVVVLGKTSPVYFGGLNNSFTYGGFQLDLFGEFRKQYSQEFKPAYGSLLINEPTYILGRWQQTGDQTSIPRFSTTADYNLSASNATFGDASYIRIKNIALSYAVNGSLLKRIHLHKLQLFLQGQNIWTISNRRRTDPEIDGSLGSVPVLKTFSAGIKITP